MSESPERWLLLGGSGRLGSALIDLAPGEVFAPRSAELDVNDGEALARAIERVEPTWVINCAAWTDVDACEADPKRANEVNGSAPGRLARRCAQAHVPLLQVSTDFVLSGPATELLTESEQLNPINRYGQSKARGEGEVLDSGAEALVARLQWLYGGAKPDFVKFVAGRLRRGEEVPVVNGEVSCPGHVTPIARWLIALMQVEARGVVNVVEGGEVSRWEQAHQIAESLGIKGRFTPVSWAQLGRFAARPGRSVLDSGRLLELTAMIPRARLPLVASPQRACRPWIETQTDELKRLFLPHGEHYETRR